MLVSWQKMNHNRWIALNHLANHMEDGGSIRRSLITFIKCERNRFDIKMHYSYGQLFRHCWDLVSTRSNYNRTCLQIYNVTPIVTRVLMYPAE